MKKIIVDIYGADKGAGVIVQGALKALVDNEKLYVVFVGDRTLIENEANILNVPAGRYEIVNTDKFITNNDPPTLVFRGAEDSSMVKALDRLKSDDECVGMISAGNTGALLVGTICRLGLSGNLKAPCLATAIPCKEDGFVCLLDCGANTECTSDDLKRYAVMGNAFMQSYTKNPAPRVGLMSVGREKGKGNAFTKEVFEKLSGLDINFIGNLEGCDLVFSDADVVVTDGFTGNVLLKSTEKMGLSALKIIDSFPQDENTKALREKIASHFDFNTRGGAIFLGAKKTVVKMHGCSNENTSYACLDLVLRLEEEQCAKRVADALNNL